MAAGDAQRTWFPEMVEVLRARWQPSLSWDELIALCDDLDALLQQIRTGRGILPPMMWCRCCQTRRRAAPPRVSVRAAILALGRFEIAGEDEVKALEKGWAKLRKATGLDLRGKVPVKKSPDQEHSPHAGPAEAERGRVSR